MILQYLVINDDLLCNVFTLQSVWIHYKENRYPSKRNLVLCFLNDGSESSGILTHADPNLLKVHLKKHGEVIWAFANGLDVSLVQSTLSPNKVYISAGIIDTGSYSLKVTFTAGGGDLRA